MKRILPLSLIIVMLNPLPAFAQQAGKNVYADPQNLEVLSDDISPGDLGDTMKGFAMGLGVRCETCHVGEPNTPLHTFDFESDEKPMKEKARVMLRMVNEINSSFVPRLNEIEDADRVQVRCVTCHRGRPQPKLIQDVLDEELADGGIDAALEAYADLRENYYGSHSYDFSEFTLPIYVQGLAEQDMTDAAIALTQVNSEHFPDSYYTWFTLAELYKLDGQPEQAIENYRRAIELNPQAAGFLQPMIDELEGSQ